MGTKRLLALGSAWLLLAISAAPAMAAQASDPAAPSPKPLVVPAPARIEGAARLGGRNVLYVGEVGEIALRNADGAPRATMSYTSYVAKDPPVSPRGRARPVTFLFNGGPLAATVALREGLGPTRTAPGRRRGEFVYENNPDSLLDVSDLVFIDAPGTGYGRLLSDEAKREYWGVEEDGRAFADFIQAWRARNRRETSPIYIVGESYGGVRAGVLVEDLAAMGQSVDGVVLVSPAFTAGRDGYFAGVDFAVASLPTQAAIARFHGRGAYKGESVEQVAEAAQKFATTTYAAALAQGEALTPQARQKIAEDVSNFTGVAVERILKDGLRIAEFGDALIPGERIGRGDGRFHAPVVDVASLPAPYDEPGSSMLRDSYDRVLALDSQYRYAFRYRPDGAFVYLSLEANRLWNTKVRNGVFSAPLALKAQIAANPRMNVLLLGGYFDTTAPYSAAGEAFAQADLPAGRFTHLTLQSGHAIFSDPAARARAIKELRKFYLGPSVPKT